ncbi:hypothetical protein C7974DRAFT_426782 [Boeremia exigua]|uniref:uncharacterized protein n=1 Tax=Boeremia exigua TaxID=749465 RepID=UPI001E8E2259|nr:uncharacterized protein C7974DRAFT_426782 [Boeremia exigua]KAH6618492.1 hypothetical protein C7974DRAFT_426782 [Boeremia exigua]
MKPSKKLIYLLSSVSMLQSTLGAATGPVNAAFDIISRDIDEARISTRQDTPPSVEITYRKKLLCLVPFDKTVANIYPNQCLDSPGWSYLSEVRPGSFPPGQTCKLIAYTQQGCVNENPRGTTIGCLENLLSPSRSYKWDCQEDPETPEPSLYPSATATLFERSECSEATGEEGEVIVNGKFDAGTIPANTCQDFDGEKAGFGTFNSSLMTPNEAIPENVVCYWEVYENPGCEKESKYDVKGTKSCLTNLGGRGPSAQKQGRSYQWVCYTPPSARVTLYSDEVCGEVNQTFSNVSPNNCRSFAPPSTDQSTPKPQFRSGNVAAERTIPDGLYCRLVVSSGEVCSLEIDSKPPGTCVVAYFKQGEDIYAGESYKWFCTPRHPFDPLSG